MSKGSTQDSVPHKDLYTFICWGHGLFKQRLLERSKWCALNVMITPEHYTSVLYTLDIWVFCSSNICINEFAQNMISEYFILLSHESLNHKKQKTARSPSGYAAATRLSEKHTEQLTEHTILESCGEVELCNHLVHPRIYFDDAARTVEHVWLFWREPPSLQKHRSIWRALLLS